MIFLPRIFNSSRYKELLFQRGKYILENVYVQEIHDQK